MNVETSGKYRISLLGSFELTGPQGVVDLSNKKLAALLAYLACTAPRPQPREKLSALLWGSHFDVQAKQNLRQALARLRKVLGPNALGGDGEFVSLDPAIVLSDVGRFEALLREDSRDSLSAAADLYRGRLVDDVAVSEEGWSEWLSAERERLQELALGALMKLGALELAAGRAEQALKASRRAVALDNLREDAHRLVVQALAATGRKAEALRHYQDLVTLLKRELNTEPDAATRALAADLRRAQPPSPPPVAVAEAGPASPRPASSGDEASIAPAALSGGLERRQLTIMACNLVGSATARLDPEEMHDLIAAFHKAVADAVARFDGFVAQYLSNGVLVHFGYPTAHEDDAERAVRAGLAVRGAVGALKLPSGETLQASVGIATGFVVIGDPRQRAAVGEAPTLAARLQAAASPGEIVIAAGTQRLVGRMFDCHPLPAIEMTGLRQPVEAWRVGGESAGVSRFEARRAGVLSPLIGRQEEIDLLMRRWKQAALGEGRVVLLSADPGIGKSHIAESLMARLQSEPHVCLRYFCSPHHTHSPLYPVVAQLERAANFVPGCGSGEKLDRLAALLKPASKDLPRDVALIAELLGIPADERYPALTLSPPEKRAMTLAALLDQLAGLAAASPILIVYEDAHWTDPTSLDLLDRMVAGVADLPVLLVVTFRPEFQATWVGQPHVTVLPLSRFGRRDSADLLAGITKGKALPAAVVEQVLAHADGIPLFMEELTNSLLESGVLRETSNSYVLDGLLPPLAVPTTLQASLVARLDRVVMGKEVAQIGAVIGREFSHELVAAVSGLDRPDLDAALERLIASGLTSRRGVPPIATYIFKHALVQEAAYTTILRSRRRELHEGIARVLVAHFPAVAENQPELVARHFTEGGLASEAIGYWIKAARHAVARSAHREAVMSMEQALLLLEAQPNVRETQQQAIDLCFDLKESLVPLGEFERIFPRLHQAEALAKAIDDRYRLGRTYTHFCHVYWMTGQPAKALVSGQEARAIAQAIGDETLEMRACLQLGGASIYSGDYRWGEDTLLPLLGFLEASQAPPDANRLRVAVHAYLTELFGAQGKFRQGIEQSERGMHLAELQNNPQVLANVMVYAARLAVNQGDSERAIALAERTVALCRQWNLAMQLESARGILGRAYALSGRLAESIPMLQEAAGAMATMRHANAPVLHLYLGQSYLAAHRDADALASAQRGLAAAREGGQRGLEARILCLLGDVAAYQDLPDQAESHFRDALALAEACDDRPFVAHCHFGYGKLYRRTGSRTRARKHFATATAMYREMGMQFCVEQAQAEMRQLQQTSRTLPTSQKV